LGEPWVFELRIPGLRDFFGFLVLLERVETPGVAYVRIEVLGVFFEYFGGDQGNFAVPAFLAHAQDVRARHAGRNVDRRKRSLGRYPKRGHPQQRAQHHNPGDLR